MQLLAVGESLLCDYPTVVDYILGINLTNGKKDLRMVLFAFDGPYNLNKIDVGLTINTKQRLFSAVFQKHKTSKEMRKTHTPYTDTSAL